MTREPIVRLTEAAAWLTLGGRDAHELTSAAAELLVAGRDSPALRELAGLHRLTEWDYLREVTKQACSDLELEFPEWTSPEGKVRALRFLCAKYQEGEITARGLTSWAHTEIGHEIANADVSDLVTLDDDLDGVEGGWSPLSPVQFNRKLDEAIDRFLAS